MKKIVLSLLALCLLSACGGKDVSKITTNVSYAYVAVGETYNDLSVTTSPDEDGKVSYTSGDESIVTVDEEGVITGVGAGSTTLTITSEDNEEATKELNVYCYELVVMNDNPYDEAWEWTAAYDINQYAADQTGKKKSAIASKIIQSSFSYIGAGYSQAERFGPTYDCSSLIYTLYNKAYDINVGTYTGAMATVLKDYKKDVDDIEVGDMIFGQGAGEYHVGIYLGNERMIHSGQSVGGVCVTSIYYGPFYQG